MALIRWEPVTELNTIQNEMNRLFNTFFDQPAPTGRGGAPSRRWIPAMDLVETGDQYVLRADLPGLSDDDVNVQLEDNVLTISGERKTQHEQHEEGYYRIERAFGSFARSLTLPEGVNPDGVQAHFDRGVLEIRIPKPEQKKPRQVQITLDTRRSDDTKTIEGTNPGDPQANSRDPAAAPA
ncbi:MAG TPA: Hsp20/alpha crystallin family protein [Solirubrobacteraceae bacterium]|nr:Hsp20/alpha crystallin family protein [Solirubrobacteraceae bacterium]